MFQTTTVYLRFFTGVFLLGMMVITAAYSGALVSFFSVEKYPSPPHTFEEIADIVLEQDLRVQICCMHIETAMKESEMDSFKVMTQPDRVRQIT
jgi:hypothetical protein